MENKYILSSSIKIKLNDIITSLDIFDDLVMIGTIMGDVKIAQIEINPKCTDNIINTSSEKSETQTYNILEQANENITSVCFENKNLINISVGDSEIYHIDISGDLDNPPCLVIKNYPNEIEHNTYCETCTIMMTNNYFLKINTDFAEPDSLFQMKEIQYECKSLETNEVLKGVIIMSNFTVPFDFNGDYFIWIDNLPDDLRKINIHSILSNKTILHYEIDKSFGHISHAKLISNKKLFIVRNLNQCEIRNIDNEFKIIDSFIHIGSEVIASQVYIFGSKESDDILDETYKNEKNTNKSSEFKDILKIKNIKKKIDDNNSSSSKRSGLLSNNINDESSLSGSTPKLDIKSYKISKKDDNNTSDNFSIATLDIDGNFNIFQFKKEITLFNIYDIQKNNKLYNDISFFGSDFPYYITYNKFFYCISTDYGLFVFKKKDD